MKTKNLFLGLSLLAIAGLWTGCSNDDEVIDTSGNGQAISFRTQGGTPQLRATETTRNYVTSFAVYGTDNGRVDDGMDENIFNGVIVARQVNGSYAYSPKRYYTSGASVAQFVAFSPISPNITNVSVPEPLFDAATFSFDYEAKAPLNTGQTAQEDLMVADTIVATTPIDPAALSLSSTVTLNFKHALSRIFVQAANELSETVTIRSLTLRNLYSKGKITGTPATNNVPGKTSLGDNPWTWSWGNYTEKINYSYVLAPSGVSVEIGGDTTLVTSMEQGMMILPQDVTYTYNAGDPNKDTAEELIAAGDFALDIIYDVSNLKGQRVYVFFNDALTTFEMGKQYVITVDFHAITDLVEVGFDIKVTPFKDIESPDVHELYPATPPTP